MYLWSLCDIEKDTRLLTWTNRKSITTTTKVENESTFLLKLKGFLYEWKMSGTDSQIPHVFVLQIEKFDLKYNIMPHFS